MPEKHSEGECGSLVQKLIAKGHSKESAHKIANAQKGKQGFSEGHAAEFCVFTADDRYSVADLENMAANFGPNGRIKQELGEDLMPPMVIGHEEDQTLLKRSDLPAAGWIEDVRVEGDRLMARAGHVPDPVRSWIDAGLYRTRSAEIYRDYKGKGPTLRRLALLGGDIPAKKDLGPLTWINNAEEDEPFEVVTQHTEVVMADDGKKPEEGKTEEQVEKFADPPVAPAAAMPAAAPAAPAGQPFKAQGTIEMAGAAAPVAPAPRPPMVPQTAPGVPMQRFSEIEQAYEVNKKALAEAQADIKKLKDKERKADIAKFAEDAARDGYWTGDTTTKVIEGLSKLDGVERFAEGESATDVAMQLLKAVATKQKVRTTPVSSGAVSGVSTDDFAEVQESYRLYKQFAAKDGLSPISLELFCEANNIECPEEFKEKPKEDK